MSANHCFKSKIWCRHHESNAGPTDYKLDKKSRFFNWLARFGVPKIRKIGCFKSITYGVLFLSLAGCAAGPGPVWQQELNNLHRYHRAEAAPIVPEPAGASRPDYSANGLYSCGIKGDYRY